MQVEAAERRRQESENRGIKNPDKVRRMQDRAAQMEKDELEAAKHGAGNPTLRVIKRFSQSKIWRYHFISFSFFTVASRLKINLTKNHSMSFTCTSNEKNIYDRTVIKIYKEK